MAFDLSRVDRDEYYEAVETIMTAFGLPATHDMEDQFMIMMEALGVYGQRSGPNGQVWKNYGALANLLQVARKADRLMSQHWHEHAELHDGSVLVADVDLDDAVDLLNYCVFFIRLARAGNWTGAPPLRPQTEEVGGEPCSETLRPEDHSPGSLPFAAS